MKSVYLWTESDRHAELSKQIIILLFCLESEQYLAVCLRHDLPTGDGDDDDENEECKESVYGIIKAKSDFFKNHLMTSTTSLSP